MSNEFLDKERTIIIGVPESFEMQPVLDRGYRTGQALSYEDFNGWLQEIPGFYPHRLDAVPRGRQAQISVLSATAIYAAQRGEAETAGELLELSGNYGAGRLRRRLDGRKIKKILAVSA